MLIEYLVEYYRKDGSKVGTRVSALSALDARIYVEKLPDYQCIASTPRRV